jgi:cysteine synthase A
MLYRNALELIGNTPLLELNNLKKKYNLKANIFAKLESYNLTGSIKDRASLKMILDLEKENKIKEGYTLIEATSGNTGNGLACIGKLRGYKVIIVMPNTMSKERIDILKAYDAEVILTDGKLGMSESLRKAQELNKEIKDSIIVSQFENHSNVLAHYENTSKELLNDLERIDIFISAIGTGGTISGVGKYLKEVNPSIKVIGVEPLSSPLLTKNVTGPHKIQGIGPSFIPKILDLNVIDKIETCSDLDAFYYAKEVRNIEAIFIGISSGAALSIAIKEAQKEENENKNIVVILPDTGNRYLSIEEFIK